jgi:putative ATP-dependent endonuclease of OLD family
MERIKSVHIENYKGFKGSFDFELNPNINIIVGNNESGKSTILNPFGEAISNIGESFGL